MVGAAAIGRSPSVVADSDSWRHYRSDVQLTGEEAACGVEDPSRVCQKIYDWTDNETLAQFSEWVIDRPVRVLIILLIAWVLNRLGRRLIGGLADRIRSTPPHPRLDRLRRREPGAEELRRPEADRAPARAEAIESVLKSVVTAVVSTIALLLVLSEVQINLAPFIAGAGIVGIALGFGAQSIVRDFLAGVFILIEDQYGIGDVIEIDTDVIGEVEDITLRITRLRDIEGTVWHVPNGEIKRIGNHSQLWANAVVDIDVSYDTELRVAMEIIDRVADDFWTETHEDDSLSGHIIEDPKVLGVQKLGESAITLRLVVKTDPLAQWQVKRELRLRLKEAFDLAGIEIPFPQRTVHTAE